MSGAGRAKCAAGVVAVALAATACGGGSGGSGGSGDSGGSEIVRASWGDAQSPLEPGNTNEAEGGKVLGMIFRGLKQYDAKTGAAENLLAEKIETADSRNFTITVKDGWKFSNGEPVTSRSFVDAWNYAADVRNHQKNGAYFSDVVGYDDVHPATGEPRAKTMSGLVVKDDRTFTVALKEKYGTWPQTLGYQTFLPLPRAFFTDHAAWLAKPVGNGPYTVDSYTKGTGMKLRTWRGYPGEDKARNGGVDLKVYTDSNTAYTDLISGNLDLVDDIPGQQLKNVRSDLGDRYINQPALRNQALAFPLYDPQWGKEGMEKVRRGISMAINRDEITQQIFHGTRTPAKDWTSPALGAQGGFSKDVCGQACTYAPAEAKRLIEEGGGLPGGRMTLTSNVDAGSHREWMDAVCNSINSALGQGTVCTVNPVGTFADFRDQITERRLHGPFRSGWQGDYPYIQDFLQPLYATGAPANDTAFGDPRFDSLVDQAHAEADITRATRLFMDAEKVLAEQMPAIPLWYQNGSAGFSARLSNVALNQFGAPVYDQIEIG
ncbi:ABC transporter substrate-binding protein [Streptomyces sp. C]|uniref:peptide ABC transporter substrate-binding protein n=1 Tax=Streptomyces sp. C TaxID=253839 RepID=UPI0001B58716|nr:ABC transporter substrate-binding protein [Streptomyces sp. C]EFL12857.1 peptide transport system secreted peptide-binding protein [Streptomyces sp. C]